jgi:hypothetical protein
MKSRLSRRSCCRWPQEVQSRGISKRSWASARQPLALEGHKEILPRSTGLRAQSTSVWSPIVKTLSAELLAIAVLIELICLVVAGRRPDPASVSIEATELWYNPWPAPGDPTLVANGPCRIPLQACVPADNSRPSAANGVRAAF